MTVVSIKEARSKIGLLINKAEHGEEILITRHGRKVARIQGVGRLRAQLPRQGEFRNRIAISGPSLGVMVVKNRNEGRY